MKILITGGAGQLGKALAKELAGQKQSFQAASRQELDITQAEQVKQYIAAYKPDVIIHGAAYTNVDGAETDQAGAYRVNAVGTQNVATAALACGAKLIYVSTDYVFDGQAKVPYTEFDETNPLSVYGKTKLAGEILARQIVNKLFVVRTSWLYGDGPNFVRTMLRLAKERQTLTIVNDQYGCPTYAKDLAAAILQLAKTEAYGIYHCVNQGITTWHDFAKTIFAMAGQTQVTLLPQTTVELGRPAPRPTYAPLGGCMLPLVLGWEMRPWQEALNAYLAAEGVIEHDD